MAAYDNDDIINKALRMAQEMGGMAGKGAPDPWMASNARSATPNLYNQGQQGSTQSYKSFYDAAGVPDLGTGDILKRLQDEQNQQQHNEWLNRSAYQRSQGVYSDDPEGVEAQSAPLGTAIQHIAESIPTNEEAERRGQRGEDESWLSWMSRGGPFAGANYGGLAKGAVENVADWTKAAETGDVSRIKPGNILAPPFTGVPTAVGTAALARFKPGLFNDPHLAGTGHMLGSNPHLNPQQDQPLAWTHGDWMSRHGYAEEPTLSFPDAQIARAQELAQQVGRQWEHSAPDKYTGMYSALTRSVEGAQMKQGTAQQWMNHFKKGGKDMPAVKDEEIYWTGIGDWLKEQGNRKIGRDELLNVAKKREVKPTYRENAHEGDDPSSFAEYERERMGEDAISIGDRGFEVRQESPQGFVLYRDGEPVLDDGEKIVHTSKRQPPRMPNPDTTLKADNADTSGLRSALRGSEDSNVAQFPSRQIPQGYRKPEARDVEHPLMDALTKGGDKYDVLDAAQPVLDHMRDTYGYTVMQKGLPSNVASRGNAILNLARALRIVHGNSKVVSEGHVPVPVRGVEFSSPDFLVRQDPSGGPDTIHIPNKATPQQIADFITKNGLFSDANESAAVRSGMRGLEAESVLPGERFGAAGPREMQSPHWPKSWFEDYSTGKGVPIPREKWDAKTVERAKLFVRDMEAKDRVDAIIDPLMYENGQRVRGRVEAEQIALRDPAKAAVLNDAYGDKTAFYEHTHPNWNNDPYDAFNYPRPPGDDSAAQAFIERIGQTMKQAAAVADQARAAGVELPNRPFLLDQGLPQSRAKTKAIGSNWQPLVEAYNKGGDKGLARAIKQQVPDIDSAVKLWESTPELGQLAWDGRPLVQQIADAAKHMARSADSGIEDATLLADNAQSADARAALGAGDDKSDEQPKKKPTRAKGGRISHTLDSAMAVASKYLH